jgi:hypothetical protein
VSILYLTCDETAVRLSIPSASALSARGLPAHIDGATATSCSQPITKGVSVHTLSALSAVSYKRVTVNFQHAAAPWIYAMSTSVRTTVPLERSRASASSLPEDVLDEFMSLVGNSTATLRACSVVHSTWTHSSRARLFHTLKLSEGRHRTAEFFNALPGFATYVREIHLVGYEGRNSDGHAFVTLSLLPAVAPVLAAQVHTILLEHCHVKQEFGDLCSILEHDPASLPQYNAVHTLSLSSTSSTRASFIQSLWKVCPGIDRVRLNTHTGWAFLGAPPRSERWTEVWPITQSRLRSLSIVARDSHELDESLRLIECLQLCELSISVQGSKSRWRLYEGMTSTAEQWGCAGLTAVGADLPLDSERTLRSTTLIRFDIAASDDATLRPVLWLLETTQAPALHHIGISVDVNDAQDPALSTGVNDPVMPTGDRSVPSSALVSAIQAWARNYTQERCGRFPELQRVSVQRRIQRRPTKTTIDETKTTIDEAMDAARTLRKAIENSRIALARHPHAHVYRT